MPNLADIMEVAEALETKGVLTIEDRCTVVRNRHSKCTKCSDVCPTDAVWAQKNKLRLNHDQCVKCGACTTVCPTEALVPLAPLDIDLAEAVASSIATTKAEAQVKMESAFERGDYRPERETASPAADGSREAAEVGRLQDAAEADGSPADASAPTDQELFEAALAAEEGTAVFACARIASKHVGDPGKYAEVPCLARMEESLLLAIASRGVQDIVFVDGNCATCKFRACNKSIDDTVESVNGLVEAMGAATRVRRASQFPACALVEDVDGLLGDARRDFFFHTKDRAKDAMTKSAEVLVFKSNNPQIASLRERMMVSAEGTLPQFDPERHPRALDALYELSQPDGPAEDEVFTRLFGSVSIDSSLCTSCNMCTVFCPTGALRKSDEVPDRDGEEEGGVGSYLEFSAADCVQCNLCADACLKKCLEVSPFVPTNDLFSFEPRLIWRPDPPKRKGVLSSVRRSK